MPKDEDEEEGKNLEVANSEEDEQHSDIAFRSSG